MGILNLIILILTGTALFVWSVSTKSDRTRERAIIRLSLLGLLVTGLATGLLDGAFRYGLLLLVLVVQGIGGIRMLAGRKKSPIGCVPVSPGLSPPCC
jgi:low temperature requirement protein LtrA